MWRPIISQICFQLSTWPMKLARVSGERQLQRWSDTDTEHASPAHSSSTQSIRQLSASAGISLDEHCCCEHFLPTVESLPAVAQWNLQSRRRAFPQHKRLWRIARRICSIYAAISLHSSQRQRLHQTKAAQISQCHPNSWHQMAMISLPWLLKHQTFPVKTSSVPMCSNFPSAKRQCPSCSVKLHLNIYIVCNLSNLSQWNISKRYTYYIYILKRFMSLSFEHYYLIHVSACAWARVGCCAGCQSTSCFPNHLSNTFESSHWPMCLLPLKLLACAALADWSPSAITCQENKNTQEDTNYWSHNLLLLNSSMMMSILPLARDRVDEGSNAATNVPMSHIHHATIAVIHNRNPVWCWLSQASIQHEITSSNL